MYIFLWRIIIFCINVGFFVLSYFTSCTFTFVVLIESSLVITVVWFNFAQKQVIEFWIFYISVVMNWCRVRGTRISLPPYCSNQIRQIIIIFWSLFNSNCKYIFKNHKLTLTFLSHFKIWYPTPYIIQFEVDPL